jgi:hypothetical protein
VASSLASRRVAHALGLMQRMGYMVGESALLEGPRAVRQGKRGPPIMGPCGTCAKTKSGANKSMSRKVATVIELAKLLLLRTAFSFSDCPARSGCGD